VATVAELVDDLRVATGQSQLTLSNSVCEGFVNAAIRRMQRRHPFRGQAATVEMVYPASGPAIALPLDFDHELGLWLRDPLGTDPSLALSPIAKTVRRFWLEGRDDRGNTFERAPLPPGTTVSSRLYHYFWTGHLHLVPTPTVEVALTLDYVQRLDDAHGAATNWFTLVVSDVVLAGAIHEAFHALYETDRAQVWLSVFESRLTDAIRHDESLALSGPTAVRGRG